MCRRFVHVLVWLAVMACLTLTPAFAQSHNPPTPHVTTHTEHSTSSPAKLTLAQRIDDNPKLMARLQPLVAETGLSLADATKGFSTLGQFMAALHVSDNLKIPFAQLQTAMTTGDHDSLGKAIEDLKPTANAKVEARKAEREADADVMATRKTEDHDSDDRKDKDETKDKK